MRNKLVAQRYSKALIDLAIEKNELEQVKADIDFIRSTFSPEFRIVMASPVISGQKKTQLFKAVFSDRLTPLTFSFFNLVFFKKARIGVTGNCG
jgi:F-type H+-transporting ATPase subunit delta